MKTIELLKFLQSKIGGELDFKAAVGHENHILSIPRLLVEIQNEHVRFEIKNKTELFINVYSVPPHLLKIYHENFVTKLLDKVHLHAEIKIGDEEFDDIDEIDHVVVYARDSNTVFEIYCDAEGQIYWEGSKETGWPS